MRRSSSKNNRLGETTLRIEPVIVPLGKIGDRMLREEFGGYPFCRSLIRQGLCAALAKLGDCTLFGIRPGTRLAIDTAFLIQIEKCTRSPNDSHLTEDALHRFGDRRCTRRDLDRFGHMKISVVLIAHDAWPHVNCGFGNASSRSGSSGRSTQTKSFSMMTVSVSLSPIACWVSRPTSSLSAHLRAAGSETSTVISLASK